MFFKFFGAAIAFVMAGLPALAETPLERGRYLMNSIVACGNCHTPQTPAGPAQGMELAGQFLMSIDPFTAYAPNITPDVETGIGGWTDEQIIAAIREGRRPDGSIIGPPMPVEFYRDMSDNDVKAIVAYLRSVPPVVNVVERSTYNFPLPASHGDPVISVAEVSRDNLVEYGAYLTTGLGHCWACHTPLVNGQLDVENQMGAGGQILDGPWGVAVTPNITPHEDGIRDYSDADIAQAITKGLRPDGSPLSPPMAFYYYQNIAADDVAAIVAYLRTIDPKPLP
ncbi:MAG: c-type cytochrome [Rhizobiales bacterium]|nr:c-type cytochrome [Hyphomicrobiales bacterium]